MNFFILKIFEYFLENLNLRILNKILFKQQFNYLHFQDLYLILIKMINNSSILLNIFEILKRYN